MKAPLLALLIILSSTQIFAAIPFNGDDERTISIPTQIEKQDITIDRITMKMNLLLIKYGEINSVQEDLDLEFNELVEEVEHLNNFKGVIELRYLENLEENIELLHQEINLMN